MEQNKEIEPGHTVAIKEDFFTESREWEETEHKYQVSQSLPTKG